MTIQDVANQLIILFCERDTFNLDDDLARITVEKGANPKDIVWAALKDMEEHKLVKPIGAEERLWVLTRPINNVGQDVGLSIQTCILIADTIKTFFEANDMEYERIDPFEIHEGHIRTLLQILGDILDTPPRAP